MFIALFFVALEIFAAMQGDVYYYERITLWQMFFAFVMGFSFARQPTELKQSVLAVFSLYTFYVAFTSTIDIITPTIVVAIEISILIAFLNYEVRKKYNLHSDQINPENVCLVFYKPLTFFDYLKSLIGSPVSSCGLLMGNIVYRFKYSSNMIEMVYLHNEHREYIIIDTGCRRCEIEYLLPKLTASKARRWQTCFFRLNCLLALRPILDKIGGKWQYKGDLLSSIYIMRRLP